MAEEILDDVWPNLVSEFYLKNARVVATLGQDGGAIVEQVPNLFLSEGRLATFQTPHGEVLNLYEYNCHFGSCDDCAPLASICTEARIVIAGTFSNGLRLEIRGDGWIGYDDKGNLEGYFDTPPSMIREDDEPELDEDAVEEMSRKFVAGPPSHLFKDPVMPPQYNQATVRVPPVDDGD